MFPDDLDPTRDLLLRRRLRATPAQIWRAWSTPANLAAWWCPRPWRTEVLAFEFQPGGRFHTRMLGPNEGEVSDNPGLFLEMQPERRVVFTTVLGGGWRPQAASVLPVSCFFDFEAAEDGGTHYTAMARHADADTARRHDAMGFQEGWGVCAQQLDEVAQSL